METLQEYYARHRKALDQKILDTYFSDNPRFNDDDMVNLVNALDLMEDLTESYYFKSKRYLDTPDTALCHNQNTIHRMFNLKKGCSGNSSNKIKKVGYPTNFMICEFFTRGYFNLLYRLMYEVKDSTIHITRDGYREFQIDIDPAPPHPSYGTLEFFNKAKGTTLKLPFLLSRLRDGIDPGD